MAEPFPPRVHRFVLLQAAAATLLLAANTVPLIAAPPAADVQTLVGAIAFLGLFVALERVAVSFVWRGHRNTTAITECAVYLGFVLLTPPLVVVLVPIARAVVHFASRRAPIKGVFNVGHQTLAAGAGAAAQLVAMTYGVPIELAAVLGTAIYSLIADGLVAGLFSLIERVPAHRVYRERFLPANALALAAGLPAGVALLALYRLHPLAVFAAAPVLILLVRHSALQARVDRELGTRRRLAEEARNLVGTQDEDAIARHVLRTTMDLFDTAGRVRLSLANGRAWEENPALTAQGAVPIAAPVLDRHGTPIGTLEAWGRPMKRRFGDDERALLHLVAAQAAHAFESAHALAEVAAQRDTIARQEKLSALGTLLAGVAHEVNNPLSYMRLRLLLTRTETQKILDDENASAREKQFATKMMESMETLHRGVERLAGLSHSLKVVSKPGDGQRHPTDLNEVVQQVMTLLHAAEKDVTFDVALAPSLPQVDANAAELHQVVLNLVKNATEVLHGRSDGHVKVETRSEGGQAYLVIEDNGPGIPDELRSRLFTPFFTTKEKGTGLGLSISHQIVAAHGGELRFDSELGHGTKFTMRLPARAV